MGDFRIAINGFGRIGRTLLRVLAHRGNIKVVAVNDIAPLPVLAHLLKFDSVHGRFPLEVSVAEGGLRVGGQFIRFLSEAEPSRLPWADLDVDVVVEATGAHRTAGRLRGHLHAGAGRVILSAPPDEDEIPMVVLGVNEHSVGIHHPLLSCASCTTNSAAPLIQLIDEACGMDGCYITTVHSYTGDQRLHDAPHRDLRRARAAAQSIVPTSTGAAKALTRVFPHLAGAMGGCGIRVPVPDGSLTDITCTVRTPVDAEELNALFRESAGGRYKGILEYTEDPVVSVDVLGNPHSCLFDSALTSVIGRMVKVVAWYDNEVGYSNRLADLLERIERDPRKWAV